MAAQPNIVVPAAVARQRCWSNHTHVRFDDGMPEHDFTAELSDVSNVQELASNVLTYAGQAADSAPYNRALRAVLVLCSLARCYDITRVNVQEFIAVRDDPASFISLV